MRSHCLEGNDLGDWGMNPNKFFRLCSTQALLAEVSIPKVF